jgi:tRNA pseudouridine38-40 synthase
LNLGALQAAAQFFEGGHDFTSFAATDPDRAQRSVAREEAPDGVVEKDEETDKSTIKRIFSSAWEQRQTDAVDLLVYRVRGNGFLHHMVRNLVGTMLEAGRGHLPLEQIPRILAARNRSAAGPTAPARGLFLYSVEYPAEQTTVSEA